MHIHAEMYVKGIWLSETSVCEKATYPLNPRISKLAQTNCKTETKSNAFVKGVHWLSKWGRNTQNATLYPTDSKEIIS